MELKIDYCLIYTKKAHKGGHHVRITKVRDSLSLIMADYHDAISWAICVPAMELTVVSLARRSYTEQSILPEDL